MNTLSVVNTTNMTTSQDVGEVLYTKFISYLDAKPRTVETYTKSLRVFFNWMHDNGISHPTFEDVKAYRDSLLQQYKPSTVQAYVFVVRRFFEFTESQGLYPNVAGKLKGATLSREPKKDYLTSAQIKSVLGGIDDSTLQGMRDKAIFSLMVSCGLRDIEVSRANVEDMRVLGDNTVLYVQGKGRDERNEFVIIPSKVESAIRAYLKLRGNANGSEPLFTSLSNNSRGQHMSTRSISAIAKGAMVAAGFDSDRLTAHSLRHTAVTLALLNGATVQEACQFARHKSIATTQIYSHNLEAQRNRCSGLVADSIF